MACRGDKGNDSRCGCDTAVRRRGEFGGAQSKVARGGGGSLQGASSRLAATVVYMDFISLGSAQRVAEHSST